MNADLDKIRALRGNTAAKPGQTLPSDPKAIPLMLGQVMIQTHLETRHILAVGTTGAGKSQAIYDLLTRIRARLQPAVIIDHSAEFLQRYYREGTDLIFNPFDERSVGWSPFNEITRVYDFDRMAKAIIPDIPGENQEWQVGAQMILADVMRGLWTLGPAHRNNKALLYRLTQAPLRGVSEASLETLLKGTLSGRAFEPGNEKSLAITLNIVARYMQPFRYLKEGDFSVTKFVKSFKNGKQKRWLFLAYTDASYQAIKTIFSIMVSCAIQAGLELSESRDRRFFFILDEFSSLSKIDAIDDALVKLRKRGGCLVAGIQSTAQLIVEYGEHGAQTLLSCFGNALLLRVADDQTAEKLSKMCGQVEQWEPSFNSSVGEGATEGASPSSSSNWSEGWSKQKQVKDSILASEFIWLKDLTGFVRIAGHGNSVVMVHIPVSDLSLVAPAELTRSDVWLEEIADDDEDYGSAISYSA